MTDDPRTDDLLRASLHAEADGVEADDALLDRIRVATRPAPAWRRRTPLLAMAAAVVVVVGLVATVMDRDEESLVLEQPDLPSLAPEDLRARLADLDRCQPLAQEGAPAVRVLVFIDPTDEQEGVEAQAELEAHLSALRLAPVRIRPSQLRTELIEAGLVDPAAEQLTTPATPFAYVLEVATPDEATVILEGISDRPGVWATSVTDCRDLGAGPTPADTTVPHTPPPAGERPTLVALVRDDGMLMTVDLESGERRELHTVGDPRNTSMEGGPSYIEAVDLSPDGAWIYFSTCCEPASGNSYRIPVTGGEPELFAAGAYPRVSPDGRWVATGGADFLIVTSTDGTTGGSPASLQLDDCCIRSLAWSPDGTELALVVGRDGQTSQIRRFTWDGTGLAEGEMGKPDNPGSFVMWMPNGTLSISSGAPIANDRGRSQDASYHWILWVDEGGVVKEQEGFDSGDITPIPGLPRALAADW